MNEGSITHNSMGRGGLDKKKACVFLILVAVGILCICALAYMLFFATPHANTTIKNGGHSLIRWEAPPGVFRAVSLSVREQRRALFEQRFFLALASAI
jgi:hypothetical protein